ncbi:MAG: T9SS C-terminal target domain-containing protein [Ignavibacteriales bacterium]|jgi:hypothetical protein|nr:MAG: T9SS C-terminal target domain-containing protein [Ignavibacteriales bacterium]
MKRNLINHLIIICFLLTLSIAQTKDPFVCSMTSLSTSGQWKPAKTPVGSYFRVLIAFAQFESDTKADSSWPLNSLPLWANDFIDDTVKDNYTNQTISDYFDVASMGNLNFIGDVYQDTIIIQQDLSYGAASEIVLEELNDSIRDFSRYDNWKYENGEFVFEEDSADGYIDMIIIIYRNEQDSLNLPGGIAVLGLSAEFSTYDGFIIDSGQFFQFGNYEFGGLCASTGLGGKFFNISIIAHEYSHYLFGEGHLNFGGLMPGGLLNPGAGSTSTFMMNAWEREWLGYINYTVPTSDGEQITIGDFVTTGDAIKIPIPFNDTSSSTFYIIENHQRISDYDQIMRGGELEGHYNFSTTLGSGIYIWKITNGNDWYPTVDIKSADGSWQWSYVDDFEAGSGWYAGSTCCEGLLPMTERSSIHRDDGLSDRHPRHTFWNNHWAQKWVDINPSTKEWEITRNVFGDKYDAFNKDYNELFTPWSNPSSYANGATNISVELISQDQYGNITLKVYSTEASAEALPPSKPQGLSVVNSAKDTAFSVELFPGSGIYREYFYSLTKSNLTWFGNDEPDIDYYKIYQCITTSIEPSKQNYTLLDTTSDTSITITNQDIDGDCKRTYYRIIAVDDDGLESVYSESSWDWARPERPTITLSRYQGHPKLSWTASCDSSMQFIVERDGRNGGGDTTVTVYGSYWIDTSIDWPTTHYANEKTYYYQVQKKRTNELKSKYSNKVDAWEQGGNVQTKTGSEREDIPAIFALSQNYPNPFNPTTKIKYQLPQASHVTINLYDMLGREVKEFINDMQEAGFYELNFDGSDLSSGTYIYRITAGDFVDSKKLLLIK